jgi:hypothetical protein
MTGAVKGGVEPLEEAVGIEDGGKEGGGQNQGGNQGS